MSRDKWDTCPLTGISKKALRLSDYANHQGEFKAELFPDCNLFDVSSIAHVAMPGTRRDNFIRAYKRDLQIDPSSPSMHMHHLINGDGKTIGYATHTNSAQAGGNTLKNSGKERQKVGKKITDVSSGSA